MDATVCAWVTHGALLVGLCLTGTAHSQVCYELVRQKEIRPRMFPLSFQHTSSERRDG